MSGPYPSMNYRREDDENPLSPVRFRPPPAPPIVTRGIGFWTPLCIIGGTFLAAVVAVLHHVFDAHLNGRTTLGTWTQTTSGRIEILLANAYKLFYTFSAGVSLCQLTWYSLRRTPVSYLWPPSRGPALTALPRPNIVSRMPLIVVMTSAILASPIITILAPSLNTHQASGTINTLTIPTLNTTTDAVQNDFYLATDSYGTVTETWDKTALVALLSTEPVGWPMPEGCAPECSYSFTYVAPALRCTDLQPDQIADGVEPTYRFVPRTFQDPPAAYLLAYDALAVGAGYQSSPLNFTVANTASHVTDQYTCTLAYVPYLASNAEDGALINAAGSVCTFYNATHVAKTHYFNGTQQSSVSVTEFHNPLNTTYRQQGFAPDLFAGSADRGVVFSPGVGSQVHLLAMADSLTTHLAGNLIIGRFGALTSTTMLTETNIFEPYNVETLAQVGSANPGMNTTAPVTNVSQALQDLLANATLGFVNLATGNTTVTASVLSATLIYTYNRTTLIATYGTSFALLVLMGAVRPVLSSAARCD
ncbi:hypothetical protein C8R46DRAFT_1241307 [Mycena filopes]|nr:hypothetical protein C8R46DRAFT_1241307 [Mycena filopes]